MLIFTLGELYGAVAVTVKVFVPGANSTVHDVAVPE